MTLAAFAADWYAARAAGIVAYVLLTVSIALGLLMARKESFQRWPRFALEDVHRFAGTLAGVLIGLHGLLILVDSQAHLGLANAIVPFTSRYRPLWTGLGIAGAELLAGLALTNHYRKRIPYRLWRRLHVLNLVVWLAATAHGLGAGTDSGSAWMIALYAGSISFVGLLAAGRISADSAPRARPAPRSET